MKIYKGFTLAEVLITLGVIGVVAAVTLPNVVKNYQKRVTVERLKVVFSQLSQAVKLAEAENGGIIDWDFRQSNYDSFNKYLKKHIKIIKETSHNHLYNEGIRYKELSGNEVPGANSLWFVRSPIGVYTTANGTDLCLFKTSSSGSFANYKWFEIYVDINGIKNKPNMFGKDAFIIDITQSINQPVYFLGTYSDSEFTFENEPNSDREVLLGKKNPKSGGLDYQCNKNKRGAWCGRLIQVDGWKISDDYPW